MTRHLLHPELTTLWLLHTVAGHAVPLLGSCLSPHSRLLPSPLVLSNGWLSSKPLHLPHPQHPQLSSPQGGKKEISCRDLSLICTLDVTPSREAPPHRVQLYCPLHPPPRTHRCTVSRDSFTLGVAPAREAEHRPSTQPSSLSLLFFFLIPE